MPSVRRTGQVSAGGFRRHRLDADTLSHLRHCKQQKGKSELQAVSGVSHLQTGKVLCEVPRSRECFATPAIADGRIYIRTGSALHCFGE